MNNNEYQIIDTHVHLDAQDYQEDLPEVIARAHKAGVAKLVSIGAGYGKESAKRAVSIAEQYDSVWAVVGIHPHDSECELDIPYLRDLASHKKVVGIGETGLDFYRDWSPRDCQENWFRAQINLAKEVGKPLVIHSREAGEDCIRILIEEGAEEVGGVFHCYAEDSSFAKRLSEINFIVSVPGSLTFKKADELRETIREIPLESIMVETDGPFLAPVPYRGKRCESAYIVETVKMLAEIKGISIEECARTTTATAESFFKLPKS